MHDDQHSGPGKGFVLVAGGASVDVLGRRTADGPGPDSAPGVIEQAPGGVARNIAENLARLGQPVRLVTRVGTDPAGEWLLGRTAEAGVDTTAALRDADRPSARYLAVHDAGGSLLAAVADMRTLDSLDPVQLERATPLLTRARLVLIDANLSAATLRWLVAHATAPVFADATSAAKAPRLRDICQRLHTLKLNLLEARALAGCPGGDWRTCAGRLLEFGVTRVVVSLGPGGLGYADAGCCVARPARAQEISSEAGAGDALSAGLAAAWLRGLGLDRQLQYAQACAALTLGSARANHPGLSHSRIDRLVSR